ncbi:MAG: ATP-binding protein [Planctomycetota bacterium]
MDSSDDTYFQQLCDSLGFICIGVDPDLRVRYWNRQAVKHYGRTIEEIRGHSVLEVFEEPDREPAEKLFRGCLETGKSSDLEIKYDRESGSPSTFIAIISPIVDASGQCIGASAGMRDISNRKKLSQELARSKRMASLGNMAAAVTHHFNNILGGMMTSIDFALPSDSPRELRKTLRLLAETIGRATRITKQLSAFAEQENVLLDEMSPLANLLERFVNKARVLAKSANVDVVAAVEEMPSGLFEAQRVLPVLESLAQNAIDAMPTGGTLTITTHRDKDHAIIILTDTGCGISESAQEHMFEPFFTTKGELGGGDSDNIGLGLAAVHGLVSEMSGTIGMTSKVGVGTTVRIRLPLRLEATPSVVK